MYNNSKRLTTLLGLSLFLTSALPALAAAPDRSGIRPSPTGTTRNTTACALFDKRSDSLEQRAAEKKAELSKKEEEQRSKLAKSREERTSKLEDTRENGEAARNEQYAKLLGKATTDAQKQAVTTYQNTMTAAIKTRQAAVDAAIAAFRAGVDAALAANKKAVDAAVKKFAAAVTAAESKAKADCAAGTDPKTVKEQLKTSIEAARTQLEADRKAIAPLQDQINTLAKTRKTAVDKAFADFKKTADAAKAALKAAFAK